MACGQSVRRTCYTRKRARLVGLVPPPESRRSWAGAVGCRYDSTSQNQVLWPGRRELGVQITCPGVTERGLQGITDRAPESITSLQNHIVSKALAVTMSGQGLRSSAANSAKLAQLQTRQGDRHLAWRMRCTMTCSKGIMTATPCLTNQGCRNISATVARSASFCSNSLLTQCLASSLMPGQGGAEKVSCPPALHTSG